MPTDRPAATPATPPDPAAKAQADAVAAAADAASSSAAELAEITTKHGTVPLNVNAPVDALGVPLKGDADARRIQAQTAVLVRQHRVDEDVRRVERGLEPRWNANDKPVGAGK